MIGAKCEGTKTALYDLVARVDSGKLQLPDFQPGWVWGAKGPLEEAAS